MAGLGGPGAATVTLTVASLPSASALGSADIRTLVRGGGNDVFLLLGGQRVPLDPASGLSPGDKVRVVIEKTGEGMTLRVSPEQASGTAASAKAGPDFLMTVRVPQGGLGGLSPGQTVDGTIRILGGRFELEIAGQRLAPDAPGPAGFRDGQPVRVRIESSTGTQLRLRIEPGQATGNATQGRLVALSRAGEEALRALEAGRTYGATVQSRPGGRVLLVEGRAAIPFEQGANLEEGQTLRIQVEATGQGRLQLRVLAEGSSPLRAQAADLAQTVARLAQALGTPQQAAELLATLPRTRPLGEAAVRALLRVFAQPDALGEDMATVMRGIEKAETAGVLPASSAARTLLLLAARVVEAGEDGASALQQWARQAARTLEGRIAGVLASQEAAAIFDAVEGDLRGQLLLWRNDARLGEFLQANGLLADFQQAIDKVTDHLLGGQLHNARGLDLPYLFLELPFDPSTGIRHAQVHLFGEGRDASGRWKGESASVAMDVSTTQLGDLWVTLGIAHGRCACTFRTDQPDVALAIEAHAPELVAGLAQAGYRDPEVFVKPWDGGRLQQCARLLGNLGGVDFQI